MLAACSHGPATPVVTEFNGDSVRIQLDTDLGFLPEDHRNRELAKADAEATKICRRGGKSVAERASMYRNDAGYVVFYQLLYLCLDS
ncbi:hypothetical protein RUA4292_00117 [Ruegeria atlantica]|uniref:Uncharacterized protein n=2 Tax=Ruegeria atlantica TaxID=81569 RepID=A0A0P1E9M4_9RHOB|nr:hypothetical protein RUA4292_00117 [Ruegeria atlantica]